MIPGPSTAASAVAFLDGHGGTISRTGFPTTRAMCSPVVVDRHPELTVVAENIGDNKLPSARFILVARPDATMPPPTGADRTSRG